MVRKRMCNAVSLVLAAVFLIGVGCGAGDPPAAGSGSVGVVQSELKGHPAHCFSDADCRVFADYCNGCNCIALGVAQPDPHCNGTLVQCFADPCQVPAPRTAVCDPTSHRCATV